MVKIKFTQYEFNVLDKLDSTIETHSDFVAIRLRTMIHQVRLMEFTVTGILQVEKILHSSLIGEMTGATIILTSWQ